MGVIAIKLPDIGEGIAEAELVEVHVKVGDLIGEDEPIVDVMTDKATVEVPASCSGTVVWIGGAVGDTLAVGADLVHLEVDGEGDGVEAPPTVERPPEPAQSELRTQAEEEPDIAPAVPSAAPDPASAEPSGAPQLRLPGTRPLAAPSVRKSAIERGIDLRRVAGSGPAGRITHQDLEAYDPLAPFPLGNKVPRTGVSEFKVAGLRKRIAERMEAAKARAPHITIIEEVDVTDLTSLRQKVNERQTRAKLTLLPFIMRAVVRAVEDHSEMNAHFDDTENVILRYEGVHIGIATQTPAGLMVPVVRHAEALSLLEAAQELERLAEASRVGSVTRDELSGSTITITSLGPLGGLATTPILNRPEVAIVGINKIAKRPMWNGTDFVPRDMMNISCSFDHRVIDGWNAAQFIQSLRRLLETPALALMEV
ncbi:MAG: 2-oxo acid dehydrogenase subunit E2 [Verrucomicrobiae bacterium]|nr:2-oxo acid dehydrogenase subunit E2 [Verrucomicrobiae bacterium]